MSGNRRQLRVSRPALVVLGYDRPESLARLLSSLARADYSDHAQVPLILSLDGSAPAATLAIARACRWPFGPLRVIERPERLGWFDHLSTCAELVEEHGSLVLLEDDLYVAPGFYDFASRGLDFYAADPAVAGLSLYALRLNECTEVSLPFQPLEDGSSVFFLQKGAPWGWALTRDQWRAFRAWFAACPRPVSVTENLPARVISWPDSSFSKQFIRYLVATGRYVVYPRASFSANFGPAGLHRRLPSAVFQVPLGVRAGPPRFVALEGSLAVYDAHHELLPSRLDRWCGRFAGYDYAVDLYGTKDPVKQDVEYLLTSRRAAACGASFARQLMPHELNVIEGLNGTELSFSARGAVRERAAAPRARVRELIAYHYGNLPIDEALVAELAALHGACLEKEVVIRGLAEQLERKSAVGRRPRPVGEGRLIAVERRFRVAAAWKFTEGAEISLDVLDRQLLGSRHHVLGFELYPAHAPSHPARHIGSWELPLDRLRAPGTRLALRGRKLVIRDRLIGGAIRPRWWSEQARGGNSFLTVTLWDRSRSPHRALERQVCHVLTFDAAGEVPLVRATLYVTNRCHLACDKCWRGLMPGPGFRDTPAAVVAGVIAAAPRLASVLLHGDGEPLLNPEVPRIVADLKRRMPAAGKIGIVTNGMLLGDGLAERLIDNGLGWASVSMDGATRETQERIRRGSDQRRILENVRRAVAYAQRTRPGEVQFTIQFTTRPDNALELPAMVRLAADLGVDHLSLGHLIDYETEHFLTLEEATLAPLYRECRELADRLGVTFTAQPYRPQEAGRCHAVDEVRVHVSGDVTLCCLRVPGEPQRMVHVLGNLRERPLLEIWEDADFVELRRRIIAGDFPAKCRGCEFRVWGMSLPVTT